MSKETRMKAGLQQGVEPSVGGAPDAPRANGAPLSAASPGQGSDGAWLGGGT